MKIKRLIEENFNHQDFLQEEEANGSLLGLDLV